MKYIVITEYVSDGYNKAANEEQLKHFMDKVSEKCNNGWKIAGGVAMAPITNHQGETKYIQYSQALIKE